MICAQGSTYNVGQRAPIIFLEAYLRAYLLVLLENCAPFMLLYLVIVRRSLFQGLFPCQFYLSPRLDLLAHYFWLSTSTITVGGVFTYCRNIIRYCAEPTPREHGKRCFHSCKKAGRSLRPLRLITALSLDRLTPPRSTWFFYQNK